MKTRQLIALENKKYPHLQILALFLVIATIYMGIASMQLFQDQDEFIWYKLFDSVSFGFLLMSPLLIAGLYSLGVQTEAKHHMWKIIYASGIPIKKVNHIKFWYFQAYFVIFVLGIFALVIGMAHLVGVAYPTPWKDVALYFLSTLAVNFVLSTWHYYLALRAENPLLTLAVAVFGTLTGIAMTLISEKIMYFLPYAWYSLMMRIGYTMVGNDLTPYLRALNIYPLAMGLVVGFLGLYLAKNVKVGD